MTLDKIYNLIGFFFIGLSVSGLITYTGYTFKSLQSWSIAVYLTFFIIFCLGLLTDDFMVNYLKTTRLNYLGSVIGIGLMLLTGMVIQLR